MSLPLHKYFSVHALAQDADKIDAMIGQHAKRLGKAGPEDGTAFFYGRGTAAQIDELRGALNRSGLEFDLNC
ncbi:MAG: hypothetical protein H6867_04395 [Rhodospirillales bacterium]|nr:hypothetical protein [Rhodospirillales bacterium]MCB9996390.1 hypothetical protein [Rhodospirillales bacterium]